jgi:hypothetical protein
MGGSGGIFVAGGVRSPRSDAVVQILLRRRKNGFAYACRATNQRSAAIEQKCYFAWSLDSQTRDTCLQSKLIYQTFSSVQGHFGSRERHIGSHVVEFCNVKAGAGERAAFFVGRVNDEEMGPVGGFISGGLRRSSGLMRR